MQPPEPIRPVSGGPGLPALMPALLGATDRSWLPEPVQSARRIVLLVVDGLGWDAFDLHRDRLPLLAGLTGGPITSVAPSTTAAALTSITTGCAPSEHGLIGYRVRVDAKILNALSWRVEGGGRPPDPGMMQRRAPFLDREVPVITRAIFRDTGFTEAHLRGSRLLGWRAVSELVEHCLRTSRSGARFVYAYYPGVDEVAHAHGLLDGFYEAELNFVDELVGRILDGLPDDTALVITADHGQVHLAPGAWRSLGPFAELVPACSGDGRFRYLHARRGAAAEVLAAAQDEHGEHAWVLSREQLLEEHWLGPAPAAPIARRLGDVVIAPFESVAILDPALPTEGQLVSAHGSLTSAEMLVPLVAGRGRA